MTDVRHYLDDGANWQAQAVLAYIRAWCEGAVLDETYDANNGLHYAEIKVGRYENCREQGYVFSLIFPSKRDETGRHHPLRRNYAVYEHRNTDRLCVLISDTWTTNTPGIDDMFKNKGENPSSSDFDASFAEGEIVPCARHILNDMKDYIKKNFDYTLLDKN